LIDYYLIVEKYFIKFTLLLLGGAAGAAAAAKVE
jgi:hypothetical protein